MDWVVVLVDLAGKAIYRSTRPSAFALNLCVDWMAVGSDDLLNEKQMAGE